MVTAAGHRTSTDKRYSTKYALVGEHADAWAYDGPVVWAEGIMQAVELADAELDKGVRAPHRPVRIISVEEIPTYAKELPG